MKQNEHGGIFFRLLLILFFLAICAGVYLIRYPIMHLAGQFWVVNDPAAQADVMIVLSDDNYSGDRAARAAELYRMGLAPVIVASGRALRPYAGISEMIERDLEFHGVPAASIVKFSHRGENTREEAEALAGLISSRGWKRVLVVTSNYHARRARFIFARVLPPAIAVRVSGAYDSEFDPTRWWETRQGRKLFFNEVLGYVVAWWELRGRDHAPSGVVILNLGPLPVTDWKHAGIQELLYIL